MFDRVLNKTGSYQKQRPEVFCKKDVILKNSQENTFFMEHL